MRDAPAQAAACRAHAEQKDRPTRSILLLVPIAAPRVLLAKALNAEDASPQVDARPVACGIEAMKDARYRMVPYGIRAVQSANRWASRMESCEEGAVHQALPLPRGRKVSSLDPLGTAGGQVSVRPGDSADECAAVASESEAPLMRQVAGVRGAFLPSADGNARQHAFCVVLGHIYVWAATNGVPGRSVEALLAQLSLANVDIGQKYHHRNSLGRYGTVASQVASVAILHAPGSGTRPGTFHTRVRGELFGMA